MSYSPIADRSDLKRLVTLLGGGPYYVYILRKPDGKLQFGGSGTAFYVGIGKGQRLFAHEKEARDPARNNEKVATIRLIWEMGGEVVRTIDSVHEIEPWHREQELINSIGRMAEGTGTLTNRQKYAPSHMINGIEHRKYASNHAGSNDENIIPSNFKLRHIRLMAGPNRPRSPTSVYGKIYSFAEANPGVTGEELIGLLQNVDFAGTKSAYAQGKTISSSWLAGYIDAGLSRSDRKHLQEYCEL